MRGHQFSTRGPSEHPQECSENSQKSILDGSSAGGRCRSVPFARCWGWIGTRAQTGTFAFEPRVVQQGFAIAARLRIARGHCPRHHATIAHQDLYATLVQRRIPGAGLRRQRTVAAFGSRHGERTRSKKERRRTAPFLEKASSQRMLTSASTTGRGSDTEQRHTEQPKCGRLRDPDQQRRAGEDVDVLESVVVVIKHELERNTVVTQREQ